ncbi:hypothetical protein [Paenibacillus sp. 1011MAR3C5]|uniref:hypothetical protein n=1 Tax=Paenibacillus sp. 1011MAR3C5 TaxID=1675787 RepID=UPI0011C37627|nr:hypothetical protein [Paenibacillus sp. 1011MAR3C5]
MIIIETMTLIYHSSPDTIKLQQIELSLRRLEKHSAMQAEFLGLEQAWQLISVMQAEFLGLEQATQLISAVQAEFHGLEQAWQHISAVQAEFHGLE